MRTKTTLEIERAGRAVVVVFTSACISDVEEISTASVRVKDHIDKETPGIVVFDFSRVKFFSSQVLGLLLEARARQQDHGGKVVICGLNAQLQRVFKITNLDTIFTFYPDKDAALGDTAGART